MFDAKSLLEALVKGAAPAPQQPQAGGMGGLGDLLGQIMGGAQPGAGSTRHATPANQGGDMGGLGDLLGKMMQGGGAPQGGQGSAAPGGAGGMGGLGDLLGKMMQGGGAPQGGQGHAAPGGAGGMGGLGDLLGKMMQGGGAPQGGQGHAAPGGAGGMGGLGDLLGKLGGAGGATGGAGAGGIADILGQILGQATSGVKEGAQKIEQHTGIGGRAREAVQQGTGQSPDELMAKLKDLIAQHQMGAAATAGGLGAVVLGTKTGRAAAMGAAKLGALALIGGLAYKAYQNYAAGKPLVGAGFLPEQAPSGSGFEPQAITNDSAVLYIRAMIAAAAADGRIDAAEQQKILGGLKQAGVEDGAREFITREIQNPASTDDLAAACRSGEEAVQVFTAARIAIDLDSNEENDFLVDLAGKLGIDQKLAQHIDAAASAQSV